MEFKNVTVRINGQEMFIDIQVRDIEDMHRASLLGGSFSLFELEGNYCMSFLHRSKNRFFLFYGYHMTEEQYLLQIQSWGSTYKVIEPGECVLLADKLYFI
jgi:hypothetical protein